MLKEKPKLRQATVRLEEEAYEIVERMAEAQELSISRVLRKLILLQIYGNNSNTGENT